MNNTISITPRRLILLGLFGLLAVLTYGFAAANTMPADTRAGDGTSPISGYTVTNVHYTLNGVTPTTIDNVTFTLTPAMVVTGQTRISLNGTWLAAGACAGAGTITCNAAGTTVLSLANLRVVAAQ